ncbi:alginate export family protein [Halopseudomonas nanhaiensis]|uniref:alginate export family protein n=1 Tax=Halopseudomonas nanhaiensis TaxID=2830842 RepID=UPI001CBD48B4|nr:alginate export family protein [Halopseudomonas nanhaiensis]UAW99614.1 alginate export family protein [Halopseudomonas nanhaiensis]
MSEMNTLRALAALGISIVGLGFTELALADIRMEYGADLRYRYEWYDMEETSRASTIRLGLKARALVGEHWSGFAELEAVEQVFADDYNVPTIPSQNRPGYPVIADPRGTEINQAFVQYANPDRALQLRLGRQEIMLNNGRFISTAGLRQNHQSFDAFTLAVAPLDGLKIEYGYLDRVRRVLGRRASNGQADMDSHFYNVGYAVDDVGVLKTYGVLLDYDDEPTNSVDTYGLSFEGRAPIDRWHLLSTLEYAVQRDVGANPNQVEADYRVLELGAEVSDIAYRLGYNQLSGESPTDKFITPLSHTFNSLTELFLVNPSLGDSHGLEVYSASIAGRMPGTEALTFMGTLYDYQADTGTAQYGQGMDLMLEYRGLSKTIISWRYGKYWADELYSDAVRTSIYVAYSF